MTRTRSFDGAVLAVLLAFLVASALVRWTPAYAASGDVYEISRIGTSATYRSTYLPTGAFTEGSLKSVVETAAYTMSASGGGEIRFTAGDFDLGSDFFVLDSITGVRFIGQGIDVTTIRNVNSGALDTEPFDVTVAFGLVLRDFTVSAGGAPRSTSDALDFDNGNNIVVERVKVSSSRARGIVFDGKNPMYPQAADGNTVRDCVVTNVPTDGIELLASQRNLIEGCQITNVGGHGIQLTKSSTTASQPNKKSSDNIVRNNTIDNSGQDGININSSDRNQIANNTITNSSNVSSNRDGVRISSSDSQTCDDNLIIGNNATDNQVTKTQNYGLNISSSPCNRTVVQGNNFAGNKTAPIHDVGTGTISLTGSDTQAPTAPTNVRTTSAPLSDRVVLAWDAASDNVAVANYKVFRDAALVGTVAGNLLAFTDATVTANTSYSYQVQALDIAGNTSSLSTPALNVTTPGASSSVTLTSMADAYVASDSPSSNFGSSTELRVDSSPLQRSFLRFDLNSVSGPVVSAKLRLTPTNNHNTGLEVRATSSAWVEDEVTWNNAPAVGALLGTSGATTGGLPVEIDVTSYVGGNGLLSFALTPLTSTSLRMGSRETATPPQLVVVFNPSGNTPPTANNATINVPHNSPSTPWSASVTDPGVPPGTLSCVITSPPAHGNATVSSDCTAGASGTYTPTAGYSGPDSFTYQASDGTLTDTGTVSVTVAAPATAPVAGSQPVSTPRDVAVPITLTATDANGDCPLTFAIAGAPAHGTLGSISGVTCSAGSATASVTYTPAASYTGPDAFTFTATDPGSLTSAPGTVTITVTAPASTITLNPVADSYTRDTAPTTNFGTSTTMRVDGSSPVEKSYLRFTVTGISGTPTSVKLRVYANSAHSVGLQVSRLADNSWTETGITFSNAPATGAAINSSGAIASGTYVEVDVTAYVTTNGTYSFVLSGLSSTGLSLGTKEAANKPQLVITQ